MESKLQGNGAMEGFQLGSLHVYSALNLDNKTIGWFWTDEKSPMGFGPFPHLHTCMSHYAEMCKMLKEHDPRSLMRMVKPNTNVIHVDFRNKKRLGT